ncbi:MAG: S1 RNA-binding domain-containing protein [Bacilli bacterium]|nr:S1 RNA-binding domain-containing protein [Bacilli bacterium]MDD4077127.1 S1 RNA-binding domain-containing protein [Bacilli bacterium]MDD4388789.1 S1 RNA-binding domain-containing protein [Bacilli bacterium]
MIKKGEIVCGRITNILGYGAFVKVGEYDGLIHISEFSDNYVRRINDYVIVGQQVKLKVLDVDEGNKKLKLSYKVTHRRRGVKSEVPKFIIGFKSLEKQIPIFIEEQMINTKHKDDQKIKIRK